MKRLLFLALLLAPTLVLSAENLVNSSTGVYRDTVTGEFFVKQRVDGPGSSTSGGPVYGPEDLTGQTWTTSTSSDQSAAITGSIVDVSCDLDTWIAIGSNPTAEVGTGYRLVANVTYRFPITSGNKIDADVASGTGNCWAHPVE